MDEVSEASPTKLRVPRRTFVVVVVVAALCVVAGVTSGSLSLGLWLVFFPILLLLTAFGVGFAQFALMLLAWASMTPPSSLSYLSVFLCVIEFALLMGLNTDAATTTTAAERRIDFALRACLALCSFFWVVDHWPPRVPNLFSVALTAFGLVIAFFGGIRWHGLYAVGMTLISGLAYMSVSNDRDVLLALHGPDATISAVGRADAAFVFALLALVALLTWGVQQTRYGKLASEDSSEDSSELGFKHLRAHVAEMLAGVAQNNKHRVPRRTFFVIALAFALFLSSRIAEISHFVVMFPVCLGVLAFATLGIRPAQISVMFASLIAMTSMPGFAHFGVAVCVIEFALLMGVVADKPPPAKIDRFLNFGARSSAAVASLWWAVDCWPPVVRLGGITMAAYGVVIACLAGHRGLMVYIVMMAPYAFLVAADAQNAAKYPEQREASGTMPDPYTAELASTAEAFALTAFVFLSLLVWRQDRARAKHDDASSHEAP